MGIIGVGDLLAVQGVGLFSDAIRYCTGRKPYSHIGVFTAVEPFPQVTEAVDRVRTRALQLSIKDARFAWVLHPPYSNPLEREHTALKALSYCGDDYGWWDIALQGLDAEAKTKWFTDHFAETKWPICSMLAALCDPKWGLNPKSVTPNDFYDLHWPTDQIK